MKKQGSKDRFAFVEFISADDMDNVLKFLGGK